ncbi:MAG: serine/threonine-protein kinase, partial [Anaerolineales bacterium]|nr:serine/threonine-protein kinase [Anaerolineales bacterium]
MTPETIGHYQIRRELGRGGMAIVYVAYDPRFEREVAIKVLPSYFVHEEDFKARFEREAKTLAHLEHYAIVPVYDYGEDGSPFLVMRFMRGGTLGDKLEKGPLTLSEAVEVIRRIGSALDAAHDRGLVHRDLKPDNILFDQYGQAYLSDFGIVKLAETSAAFTKTGGILGTPAYMSPEQATGSKTVDRRSDIYALGVILYEMLAGKAPYKADTPVRLIMKHVTEPVPNIMVDNPELPLGCETVVRRAMAKDPTSRYGTSAGMLADLEATQAGTLEMPVIDPEVTVLDQASQAAFVAANRDTQISNVTSPSEDTAVSGIAPKSSANDKRSRVWLFVLGAVLLCVLLLAGAWWVNGYREESALASVAATETAVAEQIMSASTQEAGMTATAVIVSQTTALAETAVAEQTLAAQVSATEQAVAAAAATEAARPTATPLPTPIGGGPLIAFDSARDGNREIYLMNNDGTNLVRLTESEAEDGDPKWSPDRTKLLFGSDRDGDWELYIMDPDGSNLIQLTDNASIDWAGKWSPDGSQIVFASDRDGNLEIYKMNADGSGQTRLTNNTVVDAFPSWSPDGQKILFETAVNEGGRDFFLVNADGSELTRLVTNSDFDRNAIWSPDGTRIAYATNRNREGDDEIYVMNADGSNQIRITNSPGRDFAPAWSPDGNRLLFVTDRDGNREIYMMNMDGSNPINLTNSPEDDSFPDWSPQ